MASAMHLVYESLFSVLKLPGGKLLHKMYQGTSVKPDREGSFVQVLVLQFY